MGAPRPRTARTPRGAVARPDVRRRRPAGAHGGGGPAPGLARRGLHLRRRARRGAARRAHGPEPARGAWRGPRRTPRRRRGGGALLGKVPGPGRAPARSSSRPSRAITITGSTRPRSAPRASRRRPRAPPPWWPSRRDACCSSTASAASGGRTPRASRSSVSDVGAGAPAIMLVAGEASGDLHGAALCRALRAARPGCRLFGMGGARMASAGMELLVDVTAAAATGASEAVGRVPTLYRAYRRLRAVLQGAGRPRVLVVIDFPEFNLRLARAARRAGVPVV